MSLKEQQKQAFPTKKGNNYVTISKKGLKGLNMEVSKEQLIHPGTFFKYYLKQKRHKTSKIYRILNDLDL